MRKFYSAVMAGVLTGLGGASFLGTEIREVGSFLFSIGMFASLAMGLPLFIGRCAPALLDKPRKHDTLPLMLLGNLVGAVLCGLVYGLALTSRAPQLQDARMTQSFFSTLARGMFCGMLIYAGAYSWNHMQTSKPVGTLLAVTAFIVSSFENSIADAFYFSAAYFQTGQFVPGVLPFMLAAILGNTLGPVLLHLALPKQDTAT
ncbi:MAG: formate/nitrite transporter family protein [Clostridiales bacterium]|nr:formate/nitrite transporter family protein [Clostridiales bacterium]